MNISLPRESWGKILIPHNTESDTRDEGDPYFTVVDVPGQEPFCFMCHTGENESGGVYGYVSKDLVNWTELGTVLNSTGARAHWAPSARYDHRLKAAGKKPARIVVSRGEGQGDLCHVGHKLEVWSADSIEGRYDLEAVLTPDTDFTIDFDWWVDPYTGEVRCAYAENFYDDPVGTGCVIRRVSDDFTSFVGEPIANFRATSGWQVYQKDRQFGPEFKLDLPQRFYDESLGKWVVKTWNCVEGWAGVYTSPKTGRSFHAYSAGRFGSDDISKAQGLEYGVGVVEQTGPSDFVDLTASTQKFMIRTNADKNVVDPGHGNIFKWIDGAYYYGCHIREAQGAPRQAVLFPIGEDEDGVPYAMMS